MSNFTKRYLIIKRAFSLVFLLPCFVNADVDTSNINVKVTILVPPPCVINDTQDVLVDFGNDIMTTRVDGNNYIKPINYTLNCEGALTNTLQLSIQGVGSHFNMDYLQTSNNNLGIKILANGNSLPINGTVDFTYPDLPLLQAVPIKNNGSVLKGGSFTASALMKIDYL